MCKRSRGEYGWGVGEFSYTSMDEQRVLKSQINNLSSGCVWVLGMGWVLDSVGKFGHIWTKGRWIWRGHTNGTRMGDISVGGCLCTCRSRYGCRWLHVHSLKKKKKMKRKKSLCPEYINK